MLENDSTHLSDSPLVSGSPAESTYDPISALHDAISQLKGKSDGSIKNIKSTLSQLVKRGFITRENLEHNMKEGFQGLKRSINVLQHDTGKYRQWTSHINDVRTAFHQHMGQDISKMRFGEALRVLARSRWGYKTLAYYSRKISGISGVSEATVSKWLLGTCPYKQTPGMALLDDFLAAMEACFVRFLLYKRRPKTGVIAWRKTLPEKRSTFPGLNLNGVIILNLE